MTKWMRNGKIEEKIPNGWNIAKWIKNDQMDENGLDQG